MVRSKFLLVADLIWGGLIVFVLIGALEHRDAAVIFAIIISVGWVVTQIIYNAINALFVLKLLTPPRSAK